MAENLLIVVHAEQETGANISGLGDALDVARDNVGPIIIVDPRWATLCQLPPFSNARAFIKTAPINRLLNLRLETVGEHGGQASRAGGRCEVGHYGRSPVLWDDHSAQSERCVLTSA